LLIVCFAVDFLLSLDFVCVVEVCVLQDRPDLKIIVLSSTVISDCCDELELNFDGEFGDPADCAK
jgi:hypothetical protein